MFEDEGILALIICIIGVLLFTSVCCYSSYIHNQIRYENFQNTINNLSDEQKCLHICGFQYPRDIYLDQYKFCIEKCDRISEREHNCDS